MSGTPAGDGLAAPPWSAMWRGFAGWLIAALLVRALSAVFVTHPGYIDAYYSYHVATNLLAGRGLVEGVLWNYLSPPLALPRPSNAYWPPGAALFVAAGSWLAPQGLPAWRGAQFAPVLGSALVVAGAYAMVRRLTSSAGSRRRANAVAGLTLFSGVYFPYWVTTDGFTPFALAGGATLWLAAEAAASMRRRRLLLFAAGLTAGLAQWVRPDGLLLLVGPVTVALRDLTPWPPSLRASWALEGGRFPTFLMLCVLAAGFLLGAAPLVARNWLTWGSLAPPGVGVALWLREYDELFAYSELPSFEHWWTAGLPAALAARAGALLGNLTVLGQPFLYYLLPVAVLGAWRERRRPVCWAPAAYLAALYAVMSVLFPFQGVRGGMFHSLTAVLPFLLLWSVLGVEALVSIGSRVRRWPEAQAQRVFASAVVAFGVIASGYFAAQLTGRWNGRFAAYRAVAAWLETNDPNTTPVMVVDPPGFWYASGRGAVVTPSDGFAALVAAAVQLDVDYVLLEAAAPRYLAPVYDGRQAAPDLEQVATVGAIQVYRVAPADAPRLARRTAAPWAP